MRWIASAMVRTCASLSMTQGPAMRKRLPPPTRTGPISNSRLTENSVQRSAYSVQKRSPAPGSLALGLFKPKAEEEFGHSAAGVLVSLGEDARSKGGLAQVFDGLGADFALEGRVDGDENAGATGVNVGLLVVQVDGEELCRGQVDVDIMLVDADIGWGELVEIDAGDGLAVDLKDEAVAGEKCWEDTAFAVAGDHFVHGEGDGFETREAANLHDYGGL